MKNAFFLILATLVLLFTILAAPVTIGALCATILTYAALFTPWALCLAVPFARRA